MENRHILIYNAHLFGPVDDWEPGWLLIEDKKILWMAPGSPPAFPRGYLDQSIDAGLRFLLPGFIDLHVHGAMGQEAMDASADGLCTMARFYAQHGVTAFLPTTWTASHPAILSSLNAIRQVLGPVPGGATILGVHLEGPYLNPHKCGAQDTTLIRAANNEEALSLLDSGLVRLVAIAPEITANLWLVDECARRGITVAAGHTEVSYEVLQSLVKIGVRQVTHCFNAMTGLGHRTPGTVGAALSLPEINCEIIADTIHVHPAVLKILVDVKSPQRVILVTDAIRGTGLPDGEYAIDHRTITIKDGAARLPDQTLAGSTLTMEKALHNIILASGRSLQEAWPMSSLNAARSIGVSAAKGSLEAGKDADLVLLDRNFNVSLTIAEGQVVYIHPTFTNQD